MVSIISPFVMTCLISPGRSFPGEVGETFRSPLPFDLGLLLREVLEEDVTDPLVLDSQELRDRTSVFLLLERAEVADLLRRRPPFRLRREVFELTEDREAIGGLSGLLSLFRHVVFSLFISSIDHY